MDEKKKSFLKSLKHAAVIAFGGVALLGAGYGAQKTLDHFTATPVPVVATAEPAPEACVIEASQQYDGKSWQDIRQIVPKGDGHPVVVIPGFLGSDLYTMQLRARIADQGYKVYGWNGGINFGASKGDAESLLKHVQKVSAENGGQKVSLVGYSLGGVYARELARAHPELVRGVITLGTGFGDHDWRGMPNEPVSRIYNYYQHKDATSVAEVVTPPAVPTTSIASKDDWMVTLGSTLNPQTSKAENVEVQGGHIMMPFNDEASGVVINRLSQKEGKWQPLWKDVCPIPGSTMAGMSPG